MSTTSQIENISGYLSGLSSPSGTESIIAFLTAPVSNSAGQTRLPTFSRIASSTSPVSSPSSPCRVISASRWQLNRLDSRLGYSLCVNVAVNIGLHNAYLDLVLQRGNSRLESCRLAGSGRGHEVEQKYALLLELAAQLVRLLVVIFENTLLDFENYFSPVLSLVYYILVSCGGGVNKSAPQFTYHSYKRI